MRGTWQRVWQAVTAWQDDNAFRMAAALAYYSVFSLLPLLLIGIGVATDVAGPRIADGEVLVELRAFLGEHPGRAVEDVLRNAQQTQSNSFFTVLGLGLLLVGAAWMLIELRGILDTIWQPPPLPARTWPGRVAAEIGSLAVILGTGLLLLLLLAITLLLTLGILDLTPTLGNRWMPHALNAGLSILLEMLLFAILYRMLPSTHVPWRDVWAGALFTGLLYEVGKQGISLYVGYFLRTSAFGAATSLVAVLLWVYYSSLIFIFGAEFIRVSTGRPRNPTRDRSP